MLQINIFAVPPFLSSIIVLVIGIRVFLKDPRSKIHRAHFYFCLSASEWLACYCLAYLSHNENTALQWMRLGAMGVALIPLTNFRFNTVLLRIDRNKMFQGLLFGLALLFLFLSFTPYFYTGVKHYFWGYYPVAGVLHPAFLFYYATIWLYGVWLLYKKLTDKKVKEDFLYYNQTRYVLIAWLGGFVGIVDFLPKYGIPIYPFACFIAPYWVLLSTFPLTRYRLLSDFSFLTRRALIASAFFFVMMVFFGQSYILIHILQIYFINLNTTAMLVVASMGMGFIFQPLYRRIRNAVDRVFYPEFFERQERLSRLQQEILISKNIEGFNRVILESVYSLFKSIRCHLFVWQDNTQAFILQATSGLNLSSEALSNFKSDHCIVKYLDDHDFLQLDEVRRDFSSNVDQRLLALSLWKQEAAICAAIRKDGRLWGILMLGDKESGLPYGLEDKNALNTLVECIAMTLKNIDLATRFNEGVTQTHQMNKILHRYMSPSVADEVLKRVDDLHSWKGDKRYVAVLMADLRDFTRISDNYDPEEVVRWLNEYFSEMIETILSNGGTVDKFMGDAVLAVFGAPTPLPDVEFRAVNCAVEMHNCIKKLNQKRAEQGLFPLQMGIAVTAGDVVAGNIGSDKRMEYTVIGDAVNLVSRLQGLANNGQVLTSANVAEKLLDKVEAKRLEPVYVKGKTNPLDIYEVTGLKLFKDHADKKDTDIKFDLPGDENRFSKAQ